MDGIPVKKSSMPSDVVNEDIAIFWDYENCPAPANYTGYDLVDAIRRMAQQFGSVKLFKAYLEVSEQVLNARSLTLRSELQVSGVSLTDCPHNGRKDAADKMMLVDMLAHAIDHPAPRTFILISGDRDFAYALSTLRLRRYKVVLVTLPNAHASLKAQATTCLDWFTDVVDIITPPPSSPKKSGRTYFTGNTGWNSRRYDDNTDDGPIRIDKENGDEEKQSNKLAVTLEWTRSSSSASQGESTGPKDFKPRKPFPSQSNTSPSKTPKKAHQAGLPPSQTTLNQFWLLEERQSFLTPPERPPLRTEKSNASNEFHSTSPTKARAETPRTRVRDIRDRTTASIDTFDPAKDVFQATQRKPKQYDTVSLISDDLTSNISSNSNITSELESSADMTFIQPPSFRYQSSTSSPSVSAAKIVPDPLKPLVRQLQWYYKHGNYIVLRSKIGADLVTRYKNVYKRAKVRNFTEYVLLGEKEGICELGGTGAEAWIRMCAGWELADTKW
ncbi:hypothetical protein CC2G_006015 [Coprinopsis cinerea AmutBmut pab1-1]|nr:hypothetical protein CC2G_006015 [Coprinopsis cinerea AmutBmut pab1-1]